MSKTRSFRIKPNQQVFDALEADAARKGLEVVHTIKNTAKSAFPILSDFEGSYNPGAAYSTVRHSRPWVYYQGLSTTVPMSILGRERLPPGRRIRLQRRGWRTGMLGWSVGGVLGGKLGKNTDVTPTRIGNWSAEVPDNKRQKIQKDIAEFLAQPGAPLDQHVLETDFIHIPTSSPDGYYRLVVYPSASSSTPLACSAVFRLASLGASAATPRGASPLTVIPEMVVSSTTGNVLETTQNAVQSAVPMIQKVQMIPGHETVAKYAFRKGMKSANKDGVIIDPKLRRKAERQYDLADSNFQSLGIRTPHQVKRDETLGKGGVCYLYVTS